MKIALVISALNDQGPNRVAIALGRRLSSLGNDVTFLYFDVCDCLEQFSDIKKIRVHFWKSIRLSQYDIVHSHMIRADAFSFIHKSFFGKTKFITTAHCYLYKELQNYYSKFFSFVLTGFWFVFWLRMHRICVLTKHAFEYYDKIGFSNLTVCYNGRDVGSMQAPVDENILRLVQELTEENSYVLGTYCNLITRKNIDILIRHVSRCNGASLVIIGDGPDKSRLLNLVELLKIRDRVLFLENQPEAHRFNKYFDVYAIPSKDEGFGLALVEAALHGQKIICSDIPVFREMFNNDCVFYFNLNSDESFDEQVLLALNDSIKFESAIIMAKSFFSVDSMTRSYFDLYARCIADS